MNELSQALTTSVASPTTDATAPSGQPGADATADSSTASHDASEESSPAAGAKPVAGPANSPLASLKVKVSGAWVVEA